MTGSGQIASNFKASLNGQRTDCNRLVAAGQFFGSQSQPPPGPAIPRLPGDRPLPLQQRPLSSEDPCEGSERLLPAEATGSSRPTRGIRRDCLLDSSDVLLTAMTSFEFCATTARTGIISSRFFDLPKGGDVFRLLEIHRPRWVSHSGSVYVD